MNVVSRGARNALRSPIRSGAIVIMLTISIGLVVSMLVAKSGVDDKIGDIKSTNATSITISAAGIRGGFGGGNPLTADQVKAISSTEHVASTVSTLTDQLGSTDTNLTPSLELGSFGKRMQRFESSDGSSSQSFGDTNSDRQFKAPTPRTTVTGTTDPNSITTDGTALSLTSGTAIDGNSDQQIALVGTTLASKNNLKVGDTFTAYSRKVTVKGIYKTGDTFQDNGLVMPLKTLQTDTDQAGAVLTVTAQADSSENVSTVVSALKAKLSNKADISSQAERAEASTSSLSSIGSLATASVIGATIAGAVIILLAMTMIVRERQREIGVIKAIGGTNFKVISQFVTEALTLTIIGGLVGIVFGILVSGPLTDSLVSSQTSTNQTFRNTPSKGENMRASGFIGSSSRQVQQNIEHITASISPSIIAVAIGLTLLIAIVGSALPAWFIARVRPAEVLRSE